MLMASRCWCMTVWMKTHAPQSALWRSIQQRSSKQFVRCSYSTDRARQLSKYHQASHHDSLTFHTVPPVQDARSALVVVDFYKTSCGACKYMMNGYFKLCKATYSVNEHPDVIFLKHNVYDDELGESTDLAIRLGIRVCTFTCNGIPALL